MDTNTLQILVTLFAQQKAALAPVAGGWQSSLGQLMPYVIAALVAATMWMNKKTADNSKLAVEKTIEGNDAIAEVDKKVDGALEKLMAAEYEHGSVNGKAEERSDEAKRQLTVDAVKEAIKDHGVVVSPPAAVISQEQIVEAMKKMPPTI